MLSWSIEDLDKKKLFTLCHIWPVCVSYCEWYMWIENELEMWRVLKELSLKWLESWGATVAMRATSTPFNTHFIILTRVRTIYEYNFVYCIHLLQNWPWIWFHFSSFCFCFFLLLLVFGLFLDKVDLSTTIRNNL